jgi:hypothetical protein
MNIEFIARTARLAHEVNRAYCEALGDTSQRPWDDTPENIRQSAIDGVRFHLENPTAGPEASHENWLRFKQKDGWTLGAVKDEVAKTHPNLVPFHDLPVVERVKDYIFRAVVLTAMANEPIEV